MNTTFKKSLVALALVGSAFGANAATVAGLNQSVTAEWLKVARSTGATPATAANYVQSAAASNVVAITLGAEYAVGDLITITFNKDAYITGSAVTSIVTAAGVGAKGVTLGLLSETASTITYRVSNLTDATSGANTTVGVVLNVTGTRGAATNQMQFDAAKVLANNGLKATVSAKTAFGDAIDTSGTLTRDIFVVANQYAQDTATTVNYNGEIGVEKDRKFFSDNSKTDSATVGITATTPAGFSATLTDITYVLSGDFSWVSEDAGVDVTGCTHVPADLEVTATSITFVCSDAVAPVIELDLEAGQDLDFTDADDLAAAALLNKTDYTISATAAFSNGAVTGTTKFIDGAKLGSWTLDGSTVVVPYMVHQYGKFSSILNVQNSGSKDGAISIDVWAEDGTVVGSNIAAGTSKAGSVVSVAKTAVDALIAKGYDLSKTTKYSVRIVTNVPAKNVSVNSAYADVSQATVTRTPVANDSAVQNKADLF